MMTSNDIRTSFLEFFKSTGHTVVASSPLVPANDPTLLFTNAGMVQFKDVFLGRDRRDYTRAASSQRCVRAGGKHNDLENVGYTARHHTFFEMLGNFSFGDYFKRDAILYSWELLTKVWKLPADRLWVTVYHTDDEAYGFWANDVGVPKERIVRIGDKLGGRKYESDNFWQMADTGPCGPCSEIFYDHGDKVAGGPPGSKDADGDRYIEIWNQVFMQFDRSADGVLTPLPKPCVDTGMGLERVTAVLQHVNSNYDIDLFKGLIAAAAKATGATDMASPSLRVIADHIRACAFLITDGVLPSNEGRGYVLRRIIRRAIRHGYKLGQEKPFFSTLVAALDKEMGTAYPELHKAAAHVAKVLLQEEERFAETLDQGMGLLETAIKNLKGKVIPGETVFKLYDTYGFPADLTNDIARERGLAIDSAGFEKEMEAQRDRARAASNFGADYGQDVEIKGETAFKGYERLRHKGKVTTLFRGKDAVQKLGHGEQGMVILDETPFYAESGGQVGDQGRLLAGANEFKVADTQKRGGGAHVHMGVVTQGEIKVGDTLEAQVDENLRAATVLNHSATHLLHAALRKVLGTHVTQKGSLVAPDRLRFDFSHYQAVTPEELNRIEDLVNAEVRRNEAADVRETSYDEAIKAGAMALFGEKYGNVVRMMKFGDFSTELCGGTHVRRTGDIGLFKIVSESGVAAGVRRIEAVTGAGALAWVRGLEGVLRQEQELLRAGQDDVVAKTQQLLDRNKQLEKQLAQMSGKLAANRGDELAAQAKYIGSVKLVVQAIDGVDGAGLRDLQDQVKNKIGSGIVVLGSSDPAINKVFVIVGVTSDLTAKVKAGELVNMVAQQVGGKGGGRPDMAQAGGTEPAKLQGALDSVEAWVSTKLG